MKKMIGGLLLLAVAATLSSSGCSEGKDPESPKTMNLTLGTDALSVSYQAATETVSVTADCDWGVSSGVDWLSVSPSGGISGTSSVKVSIKENTSDEKREGTLTFRYGSSSKTLSVRQNYKVEAVPISDAAFLKALLGSLDKDGDGILSTVEASGVTEIKVGGAGITDLSDLGKYFPETTILDCSRNNLTSLDLSALGDLKELDCSSNKLRELDIQSNIKLEKLDCTSNPDLKSIYVWTGFTPSEGFAKPDEASWVEPEIDTPAGYRLVWQDEFNSSSVDKGKWKFENWAPGYVNHELQRYVSGGVLDGNYTAFLEDGALNIRAMKYKGEVISARMNTTSSWKYGYMEARIWLPKGKGTWPAYWMMPNDQSAGWPACGEIDIMEEVGYHPNYTSSSIHCKDYNHVKGTQKTAERLTPGAEDGYHVYALEWTEDYIKTYVDGKELLIFRNDGKGNAATWPFDKTFYITLNLAWGGDWGGSQGVNEAALPATMKVDYVRVFQKQ